MCIWVPVWIYASIYVWLHICVCIKLCVSVFKCAFVHHLYMFNILCVLVCVCDCSLVKNIHLCLWMSCIYLFSCAMFVCACVSEYLYVYTCPWVGVHRHNSVYIHTGKYWYVVVHMHMWLCICTNVQLCICAFWNVWTSVHFLPL